MSVFKAYLDKNKYQQFDLKAVLFDMDGVLYDSMKWHTKSWKQTMDEEKIKCTADEFYLYEGMVGYDTINLLFNRAFNRDASIDEKKRLYKRKTNLFTLYNDNSLIPNSFDFVKEINKEGLTCVVVTGSGQPSLINKLTDNFKGIFTVDHMVTAFDVTHGKPHPEPFLTGLKKAGNLQPNQAIVIENAPRGVEAAKAAGIFTIAINTGTLSDSVLINAGADIVLPSMKALCENWCRYLTELKN